MRAHPQVQLSCTTNLGETGTWCLYELLLRMRPSRDRQQRQHFISSMMPDHRPHAVAHGPRHAAAGGPDEQPDWLQHLSCLNSIYQVYPQHTDWKSPVTQCSLHQTLPSHGAGNSQQGRRNREHKLHKVVFFNFFWLTRLPEGASICYWVNATQ